LFLLCSEFYRMMMLKVYIDIAIIFFFFLFQSFLLSMNKINFVMVDVFFFMWIHN
jgi:hypothetical protein